MNNFLLLIPNDKPSNYVRKRGHNDLPKNMDQVKTPYLTFKFLTSVTSDIDSHGYQKSYQMEYNALCPKFISYYS